MRKVLLFASILMLVAGCASQQVRMHRPAIYEKTKTDKAIDVAANIPVPLPVGMITGGLYASRELERWLKVYPECRERVYKSENPSSSDLVDCVREIDKQEGRIPADYVEPQRPNMDEAIRGRQ